MKKMIFSLLVIAGFNSNSNAQGFASPSIQWNIPAVLDGYEERFADTDHVVVDMNGDGKPDLVHTENQATESVSDVFLNGQQKYWKVYLNTGSGFSATATQWNIPAVLDGYEERFAYTDHVVVDMNGDGKPDLVHTENQATESVSDVFLNGQQKYWKVYLNTGTGFSATSTQWNIPAVLDGDEERFADTFHVVVDMNGDLKPDLIHTENQATETVSDVFLNGQQKYWKVYLNTGTGFSATATQWNIPAVLDGDEHRFADDYHVVADMNGDLKPDLVHTQNPATNGTSDVFLNGQQKYWKVYLNTGSGFSATSTQWNIPVVSDNYEYRFADTYHTVVDMNGDLKPDFIDTENEATNGDSDVFLNGQQRYWKVYLNNGSTLGTVGFENPANQILIYPNPSNGIFRLELKGELAQDYTCEIFNLQGQRVYQNSLINVQEIDLSNQANGMYFLRFSNGESTFTKKIVKE
jgi:beta-lactamase class D